MLIDRLKSSAVLIVVISLLVYLDATASRPGADGLWLMPVLLFFSLGTAWDLSGLILQSGRLISRRLALVSTGIVTISACVPLLWPMFGAVYPAGCAIGRLGWIVIGAASAVMIALLVEMCRYGKDENQAQKGLAIDRTLSVVFVSMYVGLPMAMFVALRSLGAASALNGTGPDAGWADKVSSVIPFGLAALLTTIAVTKSADAGAYFVGRATGRHKLIPRLSPGKTWEGAVGGVVISTIVAFVCLTGLFAEESGAANPLTLWDRLCGAAVLGPTLAISGMLGDLAESMIKRDSGAKDSGSWLPGLGGVWDVTDSLIATVVPAYICFAAGVAGPIP